MNPFDLRRRIACLSLLTLLLTGCVEAISVKTPHPTHTPARSTASASATPTRPTPTRTPTHTPTPPPTPTPYSPAFGIDYAHPENYLLQGEQSHIPDPTVLTPFRKGGQSLSQLGAIHHWLRDEFSSFRAGGRTIGVVTVEQLLSERRLGGCHDYALVFAAVAREVGYPAVMVDSYSLAWIEAFQEGRADSHAGHVFVEVYLNGRWVLIDPTKGLYLPEGYNPADPIIPLRGSIDGSNPEIYGFIVDRKGVDSWAYGIHSPKELTSAMDSFARRFDLESVIYPDYDFQRF